MAFTSVLFEHARDDSAIEQASQPDFFVDLNLDQIIDAVTAGKEEYDLKPYFYLPLRDVQAVHYRHQVMRDLERADVLESIQGFAQRMREVRSFLHAGEQLYYPWQKRRWFLDAVQVYCDALTCLAGQLTQVAPSSPGLRRFEDYLREHVASEAFLVLVREAARIRSELDRIRYNILIDGDSVTVSAYARERDYSEEILQTFEKFKQREASQHHTDTKDWPSMNHVEAKILDFVVHLNPDVFEPFAAYCERHADFIDPMIGRFDREIQFYVSYLEHMHRIEAQGVVFCYPEVSAQSKRIAGTDTFDLALAEKLRREHRRVVCNDFFLDGAERIIVVTGPNQGGKTTFSRMFGQLHYLASMGWPVPGAASRLFLCDRIFTHFEREEDMKNLRGKLHDDLYRIHRILDQATSDSIIIMNEIFSSTSLQDALFLSKKVMQRIVELDALSVYVTFIEELSRLGAQTISMLSEVDGDSATTRTFKVRRQLADGRSYAVSLAQRYRLTYDQLRERMKP